MFKYTFPEAAKDTAVEQAKCASAGEANAGWHLESVAAWDVKAPRKERNEAPVAVRRGGFSFARLP